MVTPVGVGVAEVVLVLDGRVVVERGGVPVSQFPEQPWPGAGVPSQLHEPYVDDPH